MNLFVLALLLSPAVICAQRHRKSTNPNDEPFLPIHPDYPYSPKLMKRGLEHHHHQQQQHQQQQQQQQLQQQLQQQIQTQSYAQLTPELYAPKVDARDAFTSSYAQSPSYYTNYDSLSKIAAAATSTPNALTTSPYYQSAYSSYNTNPYSLLGSYSTPYGSAATNYAAAAAAGATPGFGASPYAGSGAYPNYYYPQSPYYYPNYYGQPPYPPPPPGYPGGPPKYPYDDDDDDEEDEKRREKNSKKSGHHKNRLRHSDRDNQYVDGANYIISSVKDLDGESSTHRTPAHYNQIEDSDVRPRTSSLPKATYRLLGVTNQQSDYNSSPLGYIKVQQLEQLMRQALSRLLAQNAAQQANLAQIQQEANQQLVPKESAQQYVSVPSGIAKTGLSYVVNPTILNRVTAGQYNPSQLIQPQSNKSYPQKTLTSVTLQQSPGIYIPPIKTATDQSAPPEYGDYDSPDSVTNRSPSTVEPTRYPYSTYRPTQQTNLEDVNFGTKQKTKS